MSIARPGGPVTGISGTHRGLTFRSSRATTYIAQSDTRRRFPTQAQIDHRAKMTQFGALWRSLSSEQRSAWQSWADAFGSDLTPRPSTAPNGWNRYLAWALLADFCGLPPLDEPSNEGVGPAEFALLDLWANVEDETLTVSMIEPMLVVDESPVRVMYGLGPPRPRSRRRDPRTYGPVGFFDPNVAQPIWDVNPIVVPLELGGIPRPWFWGDSTTIGGDGNVSAPGVWPLETAGPGMTWAFRMRPIADFITDQQVERTSNGFLTFYGAIDGVPFVDPHDLTDPSNATIADLIATIDSISPWRVRQTNSAVLSRPSTDIPVFPRRGKTITSQPTLIVVPE
jgi:hypothetical protein